MYLVYESWLSLGYKIFVHSWLYFVTDLTPGLSHARFSDNIVVCAESCSGVHDHGFILLM